MTQAAIPVIDVWIDGSFASLKAEPADVDILVFVEAQYLNTHRTILGELLASLAGLDIKMVADFAWIRCIGGGYKFT